MDRLAVLEDLAFIGIQNADVGLIELETGGGIRKVAIEVPGSTGAFKAQLCKLLGEVACENEFTPQQIRVIQDLVLKAVGHDHMECCNYLLHKMHMLNCYDAQNRYRYLITMLNNDIKDQSN